MTTTDWAKTLEPASAIKAVVFDGFPIFDVRPVGAMAEALFPGHGAALTTLWRTRQFEYQWLYVMMNRYADFAAATAHAVRFATQALSLELTSTAEAKLLGMYQHLNAWPDVSNALQILRTRGLRLGILSNMTLSMLQGGLQTSQLTSSFEHVLSTDLVRSFKPAPVCYQMALDRFGLQPSEILFVAFAGWDAAGSKSFGYPTFWMNRIDAPVEYLGDAPDATGTNMAELLQYLE